MADLAAIAVLFHCPACPSRVGERCRARPAGRSLRTKTFPHRARVQLAHRLGYGRQEATR